MKKLQDEIIDTFGVNQDFIKIKNKKKQIELLYCEQIRTGDLSTGWKIEMLELDIEDLQNRQIKSDLYESIIAIEKHLGFKINPKELTVFQFYKYSKTIANRLKHEVK
jgi:acyl carrier protein